MVRKIYISLPKFAKYLLYTIHYGYNAQLGSQSTYYLGKNQSGTIRPQLIRSQQYNNQAIPATDPQPPWNEVQLFNCYS